MTIYPKHPRFSNAEALLWWAIGITIMLSVALFASRKDWEQDWDRDEGEYETAVEQSMYPG